MKFINEYINELKNICETYKVKTLYAFGSVVTNKFNAESDVDLQVFLEEMPPLEKGEMLIKLWDELENLFCRKVDLITDQEISNPYLKKSIESSKVLIYERENTKITV